MGQHCARGKARGRRESQSPPAAADLGHAERRPDSGEIGRRKGKRPRDTSERGLYAPAAGSPDALKVAPDASGDHRTHAQRGLKRQVTGRWPPDAGFSVRCPRARQAEPRTHFTGRCRDTVPASGECNPTHSQHRKHRDSVRCIIWCTSDSFFNLALRQT